MLQLRVSSRSDAPSTTAVRVETVDARDIAPRGDVVAVEEPLEVRLGFGAADAREHAAVSVTMRTPGNDFELAAGFLFTEGILTSAGQVDQITFCGKPAPGGHRNVVRVELKPGVAVDMDRLRRHFYTSSSCGVCGKTSIEAVRAVGCRVSARDGVAFDPAVIHDLPAALRGAQAVFDRTGGLHAAALFDPAGTLLGLREDVGRHNAVDKLVGARFLAGALPASGQVLLVSGRASFELVQKAMVAGIPVLAAVGAPSSLAIDLARDCGMTLLGFVRNRRFNIYTHPDRILHDAGAPAAAKENV